MCSVTSIAAIFEAQFMGLDIVSGLNYPTAKLSERRVLDGRLVFRKVSRCNVE
jgi:hypothetical protein